MHLGVDFGTTRTIVAYADRGNFPVAQFADRAGDVHDYVPSMVALTEAGLVYGFTAQDAARRGAPHVRSFKRALAKADVTMASTLSIGDREVPLIDVMTEFLRTVRLMIEDEVGQPGRTVVAVPAHAHTAQRLMTLEAFRRAGFDVAAMINEPSAAGFEYTHRQGKTLNSKRSRVLVYDLGGGTFDASLVVADGTSHEVVGSAGINTLGGDDFDEALARCAAAVADGEVDEALLVECQDAKERLSPQTKRIAVEVGGTPVAVDVNVFYDAASPLVDATLDAMAPLVGGLDATQLEDAGVAGIYLVGGASGLPLVPRALRQRFGRRVHRSPYPAASTAIGLAIAADPESGFSLTDRLSRGFGVFREADDGSAVAFDPLLGRDLVVSTSESVVVTRRYRPVHNVGWFRFVEYNALDEHGQPCGDLMPFAQVVFPFDQALQHRTDLAGIPVGPLVGGPVIEERYAVDQHGIIELRIVDLVTGYELRKTLSPEAG